MAQPWQTASEGAEVPVTVSLAERVEVASRSLLALSLRAMTELDPAISSTQLRALMVLDELHGSNLNALAAALGVSASTASRLVDRLVVAGLADRQVPAHSRREIRLALTASGRRVVRDHEKARQSVFAEALADLPEPDLRALLQGLDAVYRLQHPDR